jgi:hypothetical protein
LKYSCKERVPEGQGRKGKWLKEGQDNPDIAGSGSNPAVGFINRGFDSFSSSTLEVT